MVCQILVTCTFLLMSLVLSNADQVASKIVQIHVISMHGARTPDNFYPTDPYRDRKFLLIGQGALTNRGKLQMYKVGHLLRSYYNELLLDTPSKVRARSTALPRSQMSAALILAALYDPSESQKWPASIAWQPIPVEWKSKETEDLLDSSTCLYRTNVLNGLVQNKNITEQYRKRHPLLYDTLERYSGKKLLSPHDVLQLYVTLKSEAELDLELPEWTQAIFPEPLSSVTADAYELENTDSTLTGIQSGYLIRKIIDDSFRKVARLHNESEPTAYLYITHNTALGNLLYTLLSAPGEIVHFGSTLVFEVHEKDGQYAIQIKYTVDPLKTTFKSIVVPGCSVLCPLEKFKDLFKHTFLSKSYRDVCDHGP